MLQLRVGSRRRRVCVLLVQMYALFASERARRKSHSEGFFKWLHRALVEATVTKAPQSQQRVQRATVSGPEPAMRPLLTVCCDPDESGLSASAAAMTFLQGGQIERKMEFESGRFIHRRDLLQISREFDANSIRIGNYAFLAAATVFTG